MCLIMRKRNLYLLKQKILPMGNFKSNKSITKLLRTGPHGLSQLHATSSLLFQNSSSWTWVLV
jgi:hypothetical protein